jgi:uncharacterized damage-inducible protein DinB
MTRLTLRLAAPALLAATLALPATVAAQGTPAPARAAAAASTDAGVAALRANWQQVTRFITMSAEEFSAADYAWRPVQTVRTVGEMIGHVAGSQYSMCAAALGDPVPEEDAVEKAAKTKEALVKALKESTAYCAKAYAQDAAATAALTNLYGDRVPRANALALNAVHNGEHYGNLITYMRMKGMVPPSSRR